MNDKKFDNAKFEKLLTDKINELASSVDCFDKISKNTFQQQNSALSDDEYTISSLETVDVKKSRFRFMPVAIIASALALCVYFLPKNDTFMDFCYSNFGSSSTSDKTLYTDIMSELDTELKSFNYSCFDTSLDNYISNDLLITPMYNCPFEENSSDDINVRVYIKQLNDNVLTNQLYAIVYKGNYDDNNLIAVADSKAKFTQSELNNLSGSIAPEYSKDIALATDLSEYGGSISMSSFTYSTLFKQEKSIYPLVNEVFYYHDTLDTENNYSYFINSSLYIDNSSSVFDTSILTCEWNNSVYYSGKSAFTESSMSNFTKAVSIENSDSESYSISFVYPFNNLSTITLESDMEDTTLNAVNSADDTTIYTSIPPMNPIFRSEFKAFLPSDIKMIKLTSSDTRINTAFTFDDLNYLSLATEQEGEFEESQKESEMKKAIERDLYDGDYVENSSIDDKDISK